MRTPWLILNNIRPLMQQRTTINPRIRRIIDNHSSREEVHALIMEHQAPRRIMARLSRKKRNRLNHSALNVKDRTALKTVPSSRTFPSVID
jgi:hypothetical protein